VYVCGLVVGSDGSTAARCGTQVCSSLAFWTHVLWNLWCCLLYRLCWRIPRRSLVRHSRTSRNYRIWTTWTRSLRTFRITVAGPRRWCNGKCTHRHPVLNRHQTNVRDPTLQGLNMTRKSSAYFFIIIIIIAELDKKKDQGLDTWLKYHLETHVENPTKNPPQTIYIYAYSCTKLTEFNLKLCEFNSNFNKNNTVPVQKQ